MFQEKYETMSRAEIKELQLHKLRDQVRHAYDNVPFYRQELDRRGVKPEHIKTLEDVKLLPMTTKDDLRETYPFGMFGVPNKEVENSRILRHNGKPTVVGFTKGDIDVWSDCVARFCMAAGVTEDDIAQFLSATGFHRRARPAYGT